MFDFLFFFSTEITPPVVVAHQSGVEEEVLGLSYGIFPQQQSDEGGLAGPSSSNNQNVGSLL